VLNVFHVSDLHYTASPTGQVRDAAVAAVQGILKLAADLKSKGILRQNVCLFITGDLVFSGKKPSDGTESDFHAVQREFLKPLLEILEIGSERVFIVPGNHEVDRDVIAIDLQITAENFSQKRPCEADLHEDFRLKLSSYFDFIEVQGYQSVTKQNPRMAILKIDDQPIVCLNGLAGSYSRNGSDDKGELFILPSEMGGSFASIPEFSVVLLHHPLSWFADKCGMDLKELLSARRCRLMTGHIHDHGVDWVETENGTLAVIQAGATAETGEQNDVAVAWLPKSDSAAVRHFSFNPRIGAYDFKPASHTRAVPEKALAFFRKTEAFFDPLIVEKARQQASEDCQSELAASFRRPPEKYVSPDLVTYSEDQFSGKRIKQEVFKLDENHRVISGDELSGKTSFANFSAMLANDEKENSKINIILDFRALSIGKSIEGLLTKKLKSFGLNNSQTEYVLDVGLVDVWVDNFDADKDLSVDKFLDFFVQRPNLRWTVAVRGNQRYLPSNAPASFPKDGITYYELSEVTLPTVLKMIGHHDAGDGVIRPRAVVERVFRSINNLRAPRTIFYVDSLVDMFLSDGSVEPLNRYLLIENLLSERIRHAHKSNLPDQAIDMEMLETFIGQIAHYLLKEKQPYLSKASYYRLVDEFVERKGLQPKRFDADSILKILTDSFVLREYDGSYGFMMISIEDYFLAKHMGSDEKFRKSVMSADGLLILPSVAEYYIAQNPNDRARIEQIFDILSDFEVDVWPLIEGLKGKTINAIETAFPGNPSSLQENIIEKLGEVETAHQSIIVVSENPKPLGKTKRLKFSSEERGAVFLQLGASILGVTRTLDQEERIEIFNRLRKILLISLNGVPLIAQHLADGGEVKLRGTNIKADYVGALAVQEDRFYLILRGMLYNTLRHFATWAGSPSFFNAAVKLRENESDELISAALFAQNIEADLNESVKFIPDIKDSLSSAILKEIVLRLFVDAMTLVPLEREEEEKTINRLVNATIDINPPKNMKNRRILGLHKNRLRQDFMDKIGLNTYVGKLVKHNKTK